MTGQIIVVLILVFLINLITTLSYSVRIVGIRTGRIAVSFALFNILVLISRTAYGFQAPLLAKTIENNINTGAGENLFEFRLIIFVCSVATIIGGFLIPTFQRILSVAVEKFSIYKSVPSLILHSFSKGGITSITDSIVIPSTKNFSQINFKSDFPWRVFIMNIIAVSIITVGVLSALYAGYLNPEFRATASNLSAIINGVATILMFIFIDPFLSIMTDDVVLGKTKESIFRKYIVYMVFARVLGTVLAQFIFIPSARIIAWIAEII
jgi:hypothetical protein